MELGNEIMGEQNNIRRQTELERRVERQLSRESRKGSIDAGVNLLELRRKGYTQPYGITNFDDNRNTATNSYKDKRNNIADMDAATNGEPLNDGGVADAIKRNPQSDFQKESTQSDSGQWVDDGNGGSKIVASNGGGNTGSGNVSAPAPQAPRGQQFGQQLGSRADKDGALFNRLAAQAGQSPEAAPSPSPSAEPAQRDRSGSGSQIAQGRSSALSNGLATEAKEDARPRVNRENVELRRAMQESWNRGDALQRQGVTADSLAMEKDGLPDVGTYNPEKTQADLAQVTNATKADVDKQAIESQGDSERKQGINLASRVTKEWTGETPYFSANRGMVGPTNGKEYRPVEWTQDDENSEAARNRNSIVASTIGRGIAPLLASPLAIPALNRAVGNKIEARMPMVESDRERIARKQGYAELMNRVNGGGK